MGCQHIKAGPFLESFLGGVGLPFDNNNGRGRSNKGLVGVHARALYNDTFRFL